MDISADLRLHRCPPVVVDGPWSTLLRTGCVPDHALVQGEPAAHCQVGRSANPAGSLYDVLGPACLDPSVEAPGLHHLAARCARVGRHCLTPRVRRGACRGTQPPLSVEGPPVNGPWFFAPSVGLAPCRTAAAVKVERPVDE